MEAAMNVFFMDLDNTLIYSYKTVMSYESSKNLPDARIDRRLSWKQESAHQEPMPVKSKDWLNVEIYQGREISFITKRTHELLLELKKHALIVPATTRTNEQYGRIDLQAGAVEYALTCNGGVLLHNGKSVDAWFQQSRHLAESSREEMRRAITDLESDKNRIFEIRWIEEMFVFTKCRYPELAVCSLRETLDARLVDVFSNGQKVYVIPKSLNKGNALVRFRDYIGAEKTLAAGDSIFDLSMLGQADIAAAPADYEAVMPMSGSQIHCMKGKKLFSEEMLEFMLSALHLL